MTSTSYDQFTAVPFSVAGQAWQQVLASQTNYPPLFIPIFMEYYYEYHLGVSPKFKDLSSTFFFANKPIATISLHLLPADDHRFKLTTNGGPIAAPLISTEISDKNQNKFYHYLIEWLLSIAQAHHISSLSFYEIIKDNGMSDWLQVLNHKASSNQVSTELFIDLHKSEDEIRSNFRKTKRNDLNHALKHWKSKIDFKISSNNFLQFYNLHKEAAGRQTRSDKSWDLQKQALESGKAFLVTIWSDLEEMVGGGYFMIGSDEVLYAVAAYRRELFNQPLGHLVLWEAIKFGKTLGLRWFNLGERMYPGLNPHSSAKELNISDFKEGFASFHFAKITTLVRHGSQQ